MSDYQSNLTDNDSAANDSNLTDNDSAANDSDHESTDNDYSANENQQLPVKRRAGRSPPLEKCEFCGEEFRGSSARSSCNRHIQRKTGRGNHPAVGTHRYNHVATFRDFRVRIQTPDERNAKKRKSDAKYRERRRKSDLYKVEQAFDKLG
jgi:hypothetical protein